MDGQHTSSPLALQPGIMSKPVSYLVPTESVCVEHEVKRSRFITRLGRAADRETAMAFIHTARQADSGADHHCWAFIAGNPADSSVIGLSDDGEPAGTAGRPLLSTLQHSGLGEVVVVVSRYFGGTKLGTGGLVRAYSSAAQQALGEMPREPFVELLCRTIILPFALENAVRRLLTKLQVEITAASYNDEVTLTIAVPLDQVANLNEMLCDCCQGQATLQEANPPQKTAN